MHRSDALLLLEDVDTDDVVSDSAQEDAATIRRRVQFRFSDKSEWYWEAETLEPPLIHLRAHNLASARRSMTAELRVALGQAVQVEAEFALPSALQSELVEYARMAEQFQALRLWLRERRLPLAKTLLEHRFAQVDVAQQLHISPARLGTMLRMAGIAKHAHVPAEAP